MSDEEQIRESYELLEEYISSNSRDCEVLRRLCSEMNAQGRDLRLLLATVVRSGMYWTSRRLKLECWGATSPGYRGNENELATIRSFLRQHFPEEVDDGLKGKEVSE